MSAGKGDKPRSCFSKKFKDNYSYINWQKKTCPKCKNAAKLRFNVCVMCGYEFR